MTDKAKRRERTLRRFLDYHAANPRIYQQFSKLALQAVRVGRPRYSSWAIANMVRWHFDIVVRTKDFKLSNDYIAAYARLWLQNHPLRAGFLATRPSMWDHMDLRTLTGTKQ